MRTANLEKYQVYSSSYLLGACGGELPARQPGLLKRLLRSLLAIPGRLWRLICFKVILIIILALLCGFFFGAIWIIYETDSLDTGGIKTDWILHEATI